MITVFPQAKWLEHKHICIIVSVLTYEVCWVVLRHHCQTNITEEVHYLTNISEVGSLCRKKTYNM